MCTILSPYFIVKSLQLRGRCLVGERERVRVYWELGFLRVFLCTILSPYFIVKSLQLRRRRQIAEPRKYCLVRVIVLTIFSFIARLLQRFGIWCLVYLELVGSCLRLWLVSLLAGKVTLVASAMELFGRLFLLA